MNETPKPTEPRTVLEGMLRERRQTLEEFAEYVEAFARERNEPGTLSVRHLKRLVAGCGPNGRPLGPLRPATARLLERVLDVNADQLLASPENRRDDCSVAGEASDDAGRSLTELAPSFAWLDERAELSPGTSRRKVASRLAQLDTRAIVERHGDRAGVSRELVTVSLSEYYASGDTYRARCGGHEITTSIVTQPEWLDLACPLTPMSDRLRLVTSTPARSVVPADASDERGAVDRLAEAAALGVRVTNVPLYRLTAIEPQSRAVSGTVELAPFVEYSLTADLLEGELLDAVVSNEPTRPGMLPLRDNYLPDMTSVFSPSERMCAGGALALCAVARPADPYRGPADYVLLVQERSGQVINAPGRLSVIPKGFHEPLRDARADVRISATLLREMEEELFGRIEVDNTLAEQRVAAPMHPDRLSEPMRWLTEQPDRMRLECTGFGFNLVSGNYEFASLIVIEDDEFWTRYGGHLEANWETTGLHQHSSLDDELVAELVLDPKWSNEGLFALLQGIRRLNEIGGDRVRLPSVDVLRSGC